MTKFSLKQFFRNLRSPNLPDPSRPTSARTDFKRPPRTPDITLDIPVEDTEVTRTAPMAIQNAIDVAEDENHLQPVAAPERTQHIAQGSNLGVQILYDAKDGLDAVVDIVFVHGLTGNAYNTWVYRQKNGGNVHWPSDFLKDDIPDARILTFGYDADVVNWWEPASNNRIGNHAENLLGNLTRLRERTDTEERKIIFVMHSLGGLVVQNVLDLSRSNPARHLRNLEAATIGLAFLGTPHFGSDKAEWGAFGTAMLGLVKSTNTSIVQVLRPDSEMLSVIQKKFHEILLMRSEDLQVTCFHEELDVKGLGTIVKQQSASLPGRPSYGIHANHMGMVRFEYATDNGYEAIVGEILRWTKVARGTATESKDTQEECLRCLYFDGLESREDEITHAIPGTFSWIWDPKECNFSQWVLQQDPTVYWIRGKVSSGKSTLMKYLSKPPSPVTLAQLNIDRLVIVSYYIDRSREHKQPIATTLCGIARAFIWKILRQDSRLFNLVIPQFRELQKGRPNFEWKLEVLQDILTKIVSKHHDYNLWLLLDGLDEYPTDRLEVTEICNLLAREASKRVRLCVSSRPDQLIQCSINTSDRFGNYILDLEHHTGNDIKHLARREVDKIRSFLDANARNALVKVISQRANGLFIWAKVASRDVVDSCMYGTDSDLDYLLQRLDDLPTEIHQLYDEVLRRIFCDPNKKGKSQSLVMLAITVFGKRSFTLREFDFILQSRNALPISTPKLDKKRSGKASIGHSDDVSVVKFDGKSLDRSIQAHAGGLLDCQDGVVAFAHPTVAKYVRKISREKRYRSSFSDAMKRLGMACIRLLRTYDHQGNAMAGSTPVAVIQRHRLLELLYYSRQNWLWHLQELWTTRAYTDCISIRNQEVLHWRRLHLAQLGENTSNHDEITNPALSALATILLSIATIDIFNSAAPKSVDAPEFTAVLDSLPPTLGGFPWRDHVIDFEICIEFAPGHSVSMHASQILDNMTGYLHCLIVGEESFDIAQHSDWSECFIQQKGLTLFQHPISVIQCSPETVEDYKEPHRKIRVQQPLMSHIQTMVWHSIQAHCLNGGVQGGSGDFEDIRQDPNDTHTDTERIRFSTPMQYAAFYGLGIVIEQLAAYGANISHVSPSSQYGTPLIAAIFGVSIKSSIASRNNSVETLLLLGGKAGIVKIAGNAADLGIVTPLDAAVRLHVGYKRRVGRDDSDLKAIITLLLSEDAQMEPATRTLAYSSPGLRRLVLESRRELVSSWTTLNASTPSKSFRDFEERGQARTLPAVFVPATIGGLTGVDVSNNISRLAVSYEDAILLHHE